MTNVDYSVTEAMMKHGGRFVVCLANAARAADSKNLQVLKKSFASYWEEYEQVAIDEAKDHEP